MSKVLRLLDYADKFLTFAHEDWLRSKTDEFIEQEMKEQEKLKDENITDNDKYKSYVNPDGDFTHDDIPF